MKKTRHLSTYDYLRVLQVEYIVAELRKKIYTKKKDTEYQKRVLQGKKDKIQDIGIRNSLDTIFTDEETKRCLYKEVYRGGLPDFHYKDRSQEEEFMEKDLRYYYSLESEVRVQKGDSVVVGTLKGVIENTGAVKVKLKGDSEISTFLVEAVSRII